MTSLTFYLIDKSKTHCTNYIAVQNPVFTGRVPVTVTLYKNASYLKMSSKSGTQKERKNEEGFINSRDNTEMFLKLTVIEESGVRLQVTGSSNVNHFLHR